MSKISICDIVEAFEFQNDETDYYIDLRTNEVFSLTSDDYRELIQMVILVVILNGNMMLLELQSKLLRMSIVVLYHCHRLLK